MAFETPKMAIISSPVFIIPTDEDMYLLDTGACNHSIGAVLSKIRRGEERIIAYVSRTYSKAKINY